MRSTIVQGTVLYANEKPASDVEVRVVGASSFASSEPVRELSISPSHTTIDGSFSIEFKNDFSIVPVMNCFILRYRINGVECTFRRNFVVVQETHPAIDAGNIVLPEYPPVRFEPSVHGFHFANSFKGIPIPIDIPWEILLGQEYGLCGGMSYLSADLAVFSHNVPMDANPPRKDSRLYRSLYARQLDSFGPAFRNLFKLHSWMSMKTEGTQGAGRRSLDELGTIRVKLEMGQLVSLYLILDRKSLWSNHQVLAYGLDDEDVNASIRIYDPNCPGNDNLRLRVRITADSSSSSIVDAGAGNRPVYSALHGFFDSEYTPKRPDTI
jgi:hypothetical protein